MALHNEISLLFKIAATCIVLSCDQAPSENSDTAEPPKSPSSEATEEETGEPDGTDDADGSSPDPLPNSDEGTGQLLFQLDQAYDQYEISAYIVDFADKLTSVEFGTNHVISSVPPGLHSLVVKANPPQDDGGEPAGLRVGAINIESDKSLDLGVLELGSFGSIRIKFTNETDNYTKAIANLIGTSFSTPSVAPGFITLEDIPPGTYDLELTAENFLPITIYSVEVNPGERTTLPDQYFEILPENNVMPAPQNLRSEIGNQTVQITWDTVQDKDFAGYLLVSSTTDASFVPELGATYTVGQTVGDHTIQYVGSENSVEANSGLSNLQSYFFTVYSFDTHQVYSAASSSTETTPGIAGAPNWDRTISLADSGTGTASEKLYAVAVDSSGRAIAVGAGLDSGYREAFIVRMNDDGTEDIRQSYNLDDMPATDCFGASHDQLVFYDVAIDPADNVVVAGFCESDGGSWRGLFVAKFNKTDLTLAWDYFASASMLRSGNNKLVPLSMAVNSEDKICVAYTATGNTAWVRCINADGSAYSSQQLDLVAGETNETAVAIAFDTQDRLIIAGTQKTTSARARVVVQRFPSAAFGTPETKYVVDKNIDHPIDNTFDQTYFISDIVVNNAGVIAGVGLQESVENSVTSQHAFYFYTSADFSGSQSYHVTKEDHYLYSIALESDNIAYGVGRGLSPDANTGHDVWITRLNLDEPVGFDAIPEFWENGSNYYDSAVGNGGTETDMALGIAFDPVNHSLYTVGIHFTLNPSGTDLWLRNYK